MNLTNSPPPSKLVDYTKQRGNHHLCARNKVSTTMTKAFLCHELHSYDKRIPSMVSISARTMDTIDTDDDSVNDSVEANDFLIKVPPKTNQRQATSDLRERFQSSRRKHQERQSISFKRGNSGPEISTRSLDTTCSALSSVESINFFLKIPPRTQRRRSSDLRERFQSSRSPFRKKASIIQSILSESSTTSLASRRLPSSSSNSDSFGTV